MTRLSLVFVLAAGAGVLASQQPPAQPQPPSQQPNQTVRIGGDVNPGSPPKLAIAPFIALSQDAETVAAAKAIGDVLFDDIAYEREFYMIGRDAIATVARGTSLDNINLAPWKELGADGLIVGS